MNNSISRQELYDLVWSTPLNKLAEKFDIPASRLKLICADYEIPLPENGYWSKLKFNKEVEIRSLSPFTTKTVDLNRYRKIKSNVRESELKITQSKENRFKVKQLVNKSLRNKKIEIHTLDYAKQQVNTKITKTQVYLKDVLSVNLDSKVYNRALQFADDFVDAFKERGHKIIIVKNHQYTSGNGTKFDFYGEKYQLFMRETRTRVLEQKPNYSWQSATYSNSGKIALKWNKSYGPDWVESKINTLENKIPNIIDFFEKTAKEDIQNRIDREIYWESQKIKQAEEARVAEIKRKEISEFKALINSSGRWHKSQQLRSYLETYEVKMKSNGKLTEDVTLWLEWARKKADWYDPFIESQDELFDGLDRDSF